MKFMTLDQIEKKYGDQFFFILEKKADGCADHNSIGECNSVKMFISDPITCKRVYRVVKVSKLIKENYNSLDTYRKIERG